MWRAEWVCGFAFPLFLAADGARCALLLVTVCDVLCCVWAVGDDAGGWRLGVRRCRRQWVRCLRRNGFRSLGGVWSGWSARSGHAAFVPSGCRAMCQMSLLMWGAGSFFAGPGTGE